MSYVRQFYCIVPDGADVFLSKIKKNLFFT